MLYPIKFAPVYKDILWGGNGIRTRFGRKTPFDRVAESWELTCRPDGMGVVENGPLAGKTFAELIAQFGEALLGSRSAAQYGSAFPLLVKLIDANDRLSVQVHPTDEYARLEGEANGKNEMWYIVDAKKDAKLIYGVKPGQTRESFAAAVSEGRVEETLCEVPVKPGDFFFIPAGTVHAILDGILIAEIQQNSNTTYRIYDWGRVDTQGRGRELHTQKALDVISFSAPPEADAQPVPADRGGYTEKALLRSKYFTLDEVTVKTSCSSATDGGTFLCLMNVEGSGHIRCEGGETPVAAGDTLLLPAALGRFEIEGSCKVLLSGI